MVAADADAAAPATRFAHGKTDATQLLRRVRADDPDFLTAEVLIPHAVPFDSVALIGVANDRMRDQVREMLVRRRRIRPQGRGLPALVRRRIELLV